jgi:hypothetical protein
LDKLPQETGRRTIEDNPNITIGEWLQGIFNRQNKTWSDKTYSFEKVGPNVPGGGCLCFPKREKGAVLEIRAFDTEASLPYSQWKDFAAQIVTVFTALNDIPE